MGLDSHGTQGLGKGNFVEFCLVLFFFFRDGFKEFILALKFCNLAQKNQFSFVSQGLKTLSSASVSSCVKGREEQNPPLGSKEGALAQRLSRCLADVSTSPRLAVGLFYLFLRVSFLGYRRWLT